MLRVLVVFVTWIVIQGCSDQPIVGSFGVYPDEPTPVLLASGDTLGVYRVKYWTFDDGSAPALQLEYETPLPISDTTGLRLFAYEIWPQLAPYVADLGLDGGILTATQMTKKRQRFSWTADFARLGVVLELDSAGVWRHRGVEVPFPDGAARLMVLEPEGRQLLLVARAPADLSKTFQFDLGESP